MTDQSLLKVLAGQAAETPPCWFMRQAGRFLPEYRKIRAEAGSFLDLCYNPELASEVTLQPLRRFDMDAAILFADILLIPQALGMKVWFEQGEGPRLAPALEEFGEEAGEKAGMAALLDTPDMAVLEPIYETVKKTRHALAPEKSLIGFAGAPWTVATYMLRGRGSKDPASLRAQYYQNPEMIEGLLEKITQTTINYLSQQIEHGADAIQLFDSWAGGLPETLLHRLCLEPCQKIAAALKEKHPKTPIIIFPRGVGPALLDYAEIAEFDAIGIDTSTPWAWAKKHISPKKTVQGGLDPLLVVRGGEEMAATAREIKRVFAGSPYIFNLGHGFVPETPPENVALLMQVIREK
jgi:uroporphyrinogen decarboxylase